MNWYREINHVAAPYICINLQSGLQMIVPSEKFKGIRSFKGEYDVELVVFNTDGSQYVDRYDIDESEYNRIARQLGFKTGDE